MATDLSRASVNHRIEEIKDWRDAAGPSSLLDGCVGAPYESSHQIFGQIIKVDSCVDLSAMLLVGSSPIRSVQLVTPPTKCAQHHLGRANTSFADCEGKRFRRRRLWPPFRSLTPAPPPFSAMNSTPADSRAARILSTLLTRASWRPQSVRAFPIGFAAAALPAVVDTPVQADPSGCCAQSMATRVSRLCVSANLRVKPLNKAECDRAFNNYVATCESLAAARADHY